MNAVSPPPADDIASPPARRPAAERWIAVLGVGVAVVFSAVVLLVVRLQADGPRRVRLFDPASGDFRGFAMPEPFAAAAIDVATADGGRFTLADARGKAVLLFFGYTRCPDVCPQTLAKLTAALAELDDGGAAGNAGVAGRFGDLRHQANDVVTVFATVDPTYDTADVVRRYLAGYDARIVGLVGAEADLAALAADYDVAFGPPPTPAPGLMPPAAHGAHDSTGATGAPTGHAAHGDGGATSNDSRAAAAPASMATPELAHSSTVFLIDPAGRLRVVLGAEASPADIAHDVRAVLRSIE